MNKEECWEYYQDLLKQNGFDGITDLLSKYHELQKMVDEANAQEVACTTYIDGSMIHNSWKITLPDSGHIDLYTRPIPAQQSPAVAAPEVSAHIWYDKNHERYECSVCNGSAREKSEITHLDECFTQSPRITEQNNAWPDLVDIGISQGGRMPCPTDDELFEMIDGESIPYITEPTELELHRADYRAIKSAGFESPGELLAAYNHLLSNKVSGQDAREIAKDVFEYVDARNNPRIEDWEELCLLGLLDKLNKAKQGID